MRLAHLLCVLSACASPAGPASGDDQSPPDPVEPTPLEDTIETVIFPPQAVADDPARRAVLPACASPIATAMFEGARDVVWRGTVPGDRFATARNTADTDVLIDGPEIFPAFRALIANAKHNVSLQTYVWEPDTDPTNEILAGLRDLAARRAAEAAPTAPPVAVRLLIDASIVGFGAPVVTLPRLVASLEALRLDPRHVQVEVAGFFHIAFGNLHVKTLVVDGRDAIITGANPQAHHDYMYPWRDSGYRLTGDVALGLLADFDNAWHAGHLWTCGTDETRTVDQCIAKAPELAYVVRRPPMADTTCMPMLITTRQADPDPTSNRIDNTQDQAFLAGWGAATSHIYVQTPNLNDDAAKGALVAAVKRGVRVDVVLSKDFNEITENLPGQGGGNEMNARLLYDELEAAGITDACERLRIRWYSRDGLRAVVDNSYYAAHAKYSSIDSAVAIVGTANMDTQSWNNGREANVVVDDADTTIAWDEQFFLAHFDRGVVVDRCR